MDNQSITIVIVAFGCTNVFRRTLQSLQACDLRGHAARVLVVENGPLHGIKEACQEFAELLPIHYLHVASKIKTVALNAALEVCSDSEVCLFLDDDVRVSLEWFGAYCDAIKTHSGKAFFGGPIVAERESPALEWLKPFLPESSLGLTFPGTQRTLPIAKQFFLGFNWGARAADLRRAGGFNPRLGPGTWARVGDETEMQMHLFSLGLEGVIVHQAQVWHWVPDKRSSPDWLIGRAFGSGVAVAYIRMADAQKGTCSVFGYKRVAKRLYRRMRSPAWLDWVLLRPPSRFTAAYVSRWLTGYMLGNLMRLTGCLVSRNHQGLPDTQA